MADFDINVALSLEGHTWPKRAMSPDPKSDIVPGRRPLANADNRQERSHSIYRIEKTLKRQRFLFVCAGHAIVNENKSQWRRIRLADASSSRNDALPPQCRDEIARPPVLRALWRASHLDGCSPSGRS